ncbi:MULTISPECIES: RNA chaperone Hfq [Bacillus]|uniref:RNA chaperone Hfq n=1 Tax=Bacillus cereus TaxID=1396 RepID=A0A1S9TLT8_BACCE|nr:MULTISPECIES: RNA chaperone Hfq [Bacillus]MBK5424190.1 RNA chaperone Hfq [Bacillus sp. TH30]OOR10892.1 RNA chaperone Hfq [Bacillus cereus]WOA60455.1 RNA chaperone Hfq [Bacillus mycoides]
MRMIQEDLYKEIIDTKRTVTIFLKSGVPIRGQILSMDTYSVLVMAYNKQQLIYKKAISTITK